MVGWNQKGGTEKAMRKAIDTSTKIYCSQIEYHILLTLVVGDRDGAGAVLCTVTVRVVES